MLNLPLECLRKRSDFLRIAKTGEWYVTPAFVVQIARRSLEDSFRYGITASRKVGGAVKRNRAKRRLRALVGHVLPQKGRLNMDYVLIARKEVLRRDFSLMVQELENALIRLHERN